MLLRAPQNDLIEFRGARDLKSNLVDEEDLVEEPRVDASGVVNAFNDAGINDRGTQRLLDLDEAFLGRDPGALDESVELLARSGLASPVEEHALLVDRPHRLAERLREIAAKRHRLTHGFH